MIWVKILINFIHLASSYAWLGSIIFIAFVVKPILKKEIEAISSEILKVFFSVFRKITVISVILIIFSGILMSVRLTSNELSILSTYGIIFLIKHLLIAVIIALSLVANFYVFPKIRKLCQLKAPNELCYYQKQLIAVLSIAMIFGFIVLALTATMQFLS